jgi:hypothetical protein
MTLLQARELCGQLPWLTGAAVVSEAAPEKVLQSRPGSGIVLDELYEAVRRRMAREGVGSD